MTATGDPSGPRGHRDPAVLADKLARLEDPHVAPLSALVREIRSATGGEVPWFDPADGGVRARALLLLEAPGPRATGSTGPRAAAGGSGIVSADNDDRTAENLWRLLAEAGLPRSAVVTWNIVPWYLGSTTAIRAATREDVAAAQPSLRALLRLLPELRVVLAVGDRARDGWLRHLLHPDAPLLPTLACPHPSPQVMVSRPQYRDLVLAALRRVADAVR